MRKFLLSMTAVLVLAGPILAVEKGTGDASAAFTPSVKFNGFLQLWSMDTNGVWDTRMAHARLRATALVDEDTTLAIMPDFAPTGITLLDAYAQRKLGDGWSIQAGQFKPAFGDDRYLTPAQFKRTNYFALDSFAFPNNSNAWDIGLELKKTTDHVTFQLDAVQGAGPNKTADNDKFKDLSARLEWKDGPLALGASYYGGTNQTGATSYQNWGGAHLRFAQDGLDLRGEGILAPGDRAGFAGQAAYKSGAWEPLAWYESGFIGSVQNYQVLGLALNYWPGAKTRLTATVAMNGLASLTTSASGGLQVEQIF